jgi:quinol-cytochrome oxidoreductase complex cytochrome b subunit
MGTPERQAEPEHPREGWLAERIGWSGIASALASHRAPRRSFVFYLGGITLFLLLVQVLSGILLALYYRPDPAHAHESVEQIIGEIPYGNLVHAVHVWASDLFVACLVAHLFTVVVRRSFRAPHELTWLSGLVAMVLGIGLAFTGAILPWTEGGYTHARVGSQLASQVPFIGAWLRRFMRGGDEVTLGTLGHAYGFHVAALPACLTLFVAVHVCFLFRRPVVPSEKPLQETLPLYPEFIVRQAAAQTGVLVVIMTLAIFAERPLGPAADAAQPTPHGAGPPWYMLPAHAIVRDAPTELLGIDGARFLMGVACVAGVVVAALPFIDRRGSKITAWLAWLALLVLLLLAAHALA